MGCVLEVWPAPGESQRFLNRSRQSHLDSFAENRILHGVQAGFVETAIRLEHLLWRMPYAWPYAAAGWRSVYSSGAPPPAPPRRAGLLY